MKEAIKQAAREAAEKYLKKILPLPSVSSEGLQNIKDDFTEGYLEGYSQQQAAFDNLEQFCREQMWERKPIQQPRHLK